MTSDTNKTGYIFIIWGQPNHLQPWLLVHVELTSESLVQIAASTWHKNIFFALGEKEN